MNNQAELNRGNIIAFLTDILQRQGADSYLGEAVTMSEHMLQTAHNAQQDRAPPTTIVAALLHDIGHYSGEFPQNYIDLGINNRHETMGAAILEKFFSPAVTEPVRWHVEAKRYLCATQPTYFGGLSAASVQTLKLQGGAHTAKERLEFEKNPYLETILKVRRYDDNGKVAGVKTPALAHFMDIARGVLEAGLIKSGID